MNITEYLILLNNPNAINDRQTSSLEKIVAEFPYFQSAKALRLKGLYNEESFRYNYELKNTAAHTTDRTILFDFVVSDTFTRIDKNLYEQKLAEINEIDVDATELVFKEEKIGSRENSLEQSILTSIKEASPSEETYIESSIEEKPTPIDPEKQKKLALIDKFIEANPKIPPIKKAAESSFKLELSSENSPYLMTETLARVYLEQNKYDKAIQAYEILILKYPEKSSFFANRISDIKILQQNNK